MPLCSFIFKYNPTPTNFQLCPYIPYTLANTWLDIPLKLLTKAFSLCRGEVEMEKGKREEKESEDIALHIYLTCYILVRGVPKTYDECLHYCRKRRIVPFQILTLP